MYHDRHGFGADSASAASPEVGLVPTRSPVYHAALSLSTMLQFTKVASQATDRKFEGAEELHTE